MAESEQKPPSKPRAPRRIRFERLWPATPTELWTLWTTRAGLEAWWGPEGFAAQVEALDLRPGGELAYTLQAVGREQVAFLNRKKLPLRRSVRGSWRTVDAPHRLVFEETLHLMPQLPPALIGTRVDFSAEEAGTRVKVAVDATEDRWWNESLKMGWAGQLNKLEKILRSGGLRPAVAVPTTSSDDPAPR